MSIFGLKLKTDIPSASVIKVLKQFHNTVSIASLRSKIQNKEFIYTCSSIDDTRIVTLLKLLYEIETLGIGVEIYEQWENGAIKKVDRFLLENLLESYDEIENQIERIIDLEVEGLDP